jgi:RimJ/RimL family protein N-acetyltransferase
MAFEDADIWQSMFKKKTEFEWAQIRDEEDHFFGSEPGKSKYLLIEYQSEIIGTISHTHHDGKIESFELDMWLRSTQYTGKGIGSTAINILIDYLLQQYSVNIFIIRPWIRNKRAIRAYEKCGFREREDFDVTDYYGKYLEQYGDGDYGVEETCNMVLVVD